MKQVFKEYHQFTDEEFKQLWNDCIFVFDTNTLLNMYRYSRTTVEAYLKVLNELKKKGQLWIPYQVGFEFYENRIDVICEFEKSYDEILAILEGVKNIETKYKDHPFLDLSQIKNEINKGLSKAETIIKKAKKDHPKWMEKDEVLEKLNELFDGNIGNNYSKEKLSEIKDEGKLRYEKKIPPGYKDDKKPEDKKFGDLILWFQIIDKAIATRKPIVLISGDVKEDWWLEKDGKRVMPLPALKKEMFDKAGVNFHIYTADQFLKYYTEGTNNKIDDNTIKEVKKIRELEEKRMRMNSIEILGGIKNSDSEIDLRVFERYTFEYLHALSLVENILRSSESEKFPLRYLEDFESLSRRIKDIVNRGIHGDVDSMTLLRLYRYSREISHLLDKVLSSDEISADFYQVLKEYCQRMEMMARRIRRLS